MADASAELEDARRRYNERYPDRPIERIGDTVDPYFHLVLMSGAWENGMTLSDVEIRSVEAVTPASMFS
ncbi:hypothetical protein [Rhizobium anhuiense]|uniref:hypothetical protein n=1 Tax=Rhizobium anhuiense TaxID=1184720 RepID=UPI0007B520AB|nr:hypothetical protein [Rhizobium anhuiense]KZS51666.1 hypothetical protein AS890_06760 [Rhizobium anhuiense bv. trifolii]